MGHCGQSCPQAANYNTTARHKGERHHQRRGRVDGINGGGNMVDVFFATNRNPDNETNPTDFGTGFSSTGLANLRFGIADVQIRKTEDGFGKYELKGKTLTVDPDIDVKAGNDPPDKPSTRVMHKAREAMSHHKRDTVVFIHGYNVTFDEALLSAAVIRKNFDAHENALGGRGVNVALFSWPSDGSMMPWLAYSSDRKDARASGPAVGRAFFKIADFLKKLEPEQKCEQNIHLIAHSMGNYVLRNAIQSVKNEFPGRMPRVFDQIFMMAADEDDDAFEYEHKLKPLPQLARRVNVYFNNGDLAMGIADKTKGQPDRLGADGPRVPWKVPGKVTSIDCTPVVSGLVEHSYYVKSEAVVKDMLQALVGTPSMEIKGRVFDPETNRYRLEG